MKKTFLMLFLWLLSATSLQGDSRTSHLGIGLEMVQPLRSFDISETLYGGFTVRGKLLPILGASLSIHYIRQTYFDYYPDEAWSGPDSRDTLEITSTDWIFSQTEWVFGLNAVFYLPLGRLQPYLATGLAWILYSPSEAADYYPEFDSYFHANAEESDLYLGYLARFGAEFFVFEELTLGFDYIFKIDRLSTFPEDFAASPGAYMRDKSNLVLTCTFWPL